MSTIVLFETAEAINVEFLLFQSKLNTLVTVVGNFWLAKVDEAELVLRVELGAERGLERGLLYSERAVGLALGGYETGYGTKGNLVLFVFS